MGVAEWWSGGVAEWRNWRVVCGCSGHRVNPSLSFAVLQELPVGAATRLAAQIGYVLQVALPALPETVGCVGWRGTGFV